MDESVNRLLRRNYTCPICFCARKQRGQLFCFHKSLRKHDTPEREHYAQNAGRDASTGKHLLFVWHQLLNVCILYHRRLLNMFTSQQFLPTLYSDLPINFLLVKLNHHLLGLASSSSYTLASNRVASSCRTCDRYCLSCSASCLSLGGSYI